MGTWGTEIEANDTFADIYADFMELYDRGLLIPVITKKLVAENQETINETDDSDNFWFALAKAQWECDGLEKAVLSKVQEIIQSGRDLKVWKDLDANEKDLEARKVILDRFLKNISTKKTEPRIRAKGVYQKRLSTFISSPLGRLFLALLVFFFFSFMANLITNLVTGSGVYWEKHQWPFGASLLVSVLTLLFWYFKNAYLSKGFKRVKPQIAKHRDGYYVHSKSRESIQYVNGDVLAEVVVEPLPHYSDDLIHPDSLVVYKNGERSMPSDAEREVILKRMKEGIKCLWS